MAPHSFPKPKKFNNALSAGSHSHSFSRIRVWFVWAFYFQGLQQTQIAIWTHQEKWNIRADKFITLDKCLKCCSSMTMSCPQVCAPLRLWQNLNRLCYFSLHLEQTSFHQIIISLVLWSSTVRTSFQRYLHTKECCMTMIKCQGEGLIELAHKLSFNPRRKFPRKRRTTLFSAILWLNTL
jgi:hypothetical protein